MKLFWTLHVLNFPLICLLSVCRVHTHSAECELIYRFSESLFPCGTERGRSGSFISVSEHHVNCLHWQRVAENSKMTRCKTDGNTRRGRGARDEMQRQAEREGRRCTELTNSVCVCESVLINSFPAFIVLIVSCSTQIDRFGGEGSLDVWFLFFFFFFTCAALHTVTPAGPASGMKGNRFRVEHQFKWAPLYRQDHKSLWSSRISFHHTCGTTELERFHTSICERKPL